jgi:hypothetical protein
MTYDPHALRVLATRARTEAGKAAAAGDLIAAAHWVAVAQKASQKISAAKCPRKGCQWGNPCQIHDSRDYGMART